MKTDYNVDCNLLILHSELLSLNIALVMSICHLAVDVLAAFAFAEENPRKEYIKLIPANVMAENATPVRKVVSLL